MERWETLALGRAAVFRPERDRKSGVGVDWLRCGTFRMAEPNNRGRGLWE